MDLIFGRMQRVHVHVSSCRPVCSSDVTQTGGCQVETGLSIRKGAHHPGSSPDLARDAFQRIVGSQLDPGIHSRPVFVRCRARSTPLFCPTSDDGVERGGCLLQSPIPALLGVDGIEHMAYLGTSECAT